MKMIAAFAFFTCLSATAPALAQEPALTGCAAKRQELSQQIQQAHAAGNTQQEAGLQKALRENQAHCTDASLSKQRQEKVSNAQREVTEREARFEESRSQGQCKKNRPTQSETR